jgi:hypothetical protein
MCAAVAGAAIQRTAVVIITVRVRGTWRERHALVGACVALVVDEGLTTRWADRLHLEQLEREAQGLRFVALAADAAVRGRWWWGARTEAPADVAQLIRQRAAPIRCTHLAAAAEGEGIEALPCPAWGRLEANRGAAARLAPLIDTFARDRRSVRTRHAARSGANGAAGACVRLGRWARTRNTGVAEATARRRVELLGGTPRRAVALHTLQRSAAATLVL